MFGRSTQKFEQIQYCTLKDMHHRGRHVTVKCQQMSRIIKVSFAMYRQFHICDILHEKHCCIIDSHNTFQDFLESVKLYQSIFICKGPHCTEGKFWLFQLLLMAPVSPICRQSIMLLKTGDGRRA